MTNERTLLMHTVTTKFNRTLREGVKALKREVTGGGIIDDIYLSLGVRVRYVC